MKEVNIDPSPQQLQLYTLLLDRIMTEAGKRQDLVMQEEHKLNEVQQRLAQVESAAGENVNENL